MKAGKKTKLTRWGVILGITLIFLFAAGAIYAQGGMRPGFNRGGDGQGMGPGPGPGAGPMMFIMQDEEIRNLTAQITFISGINKLELSQDQVRSFLSCARDAQAIVNEEFGDLKDDIRAELRNQLDAVLDGAEFDPSALRGVHEQYQQGHEPGALREELGEVLDRAYNLLTEEQVGILAEGMGPRAGGMRERFRDRFSGEGRGLENMDEGQRERIRERVGEMGAGRGKIMLILLSPQAIEAFELWLSTY